MEESPASMETDHNKYWVEGLEHIAKCRQQSASREGEKLDQQEQKELHRQCQEHINMQQQQSNTNVPKNT
jgi:hypothetical protein